MRCKFLALPFFVGLISAIKINLIGELRVGEIIACVYIVINFSKLRVTKQEKTVVSFAFLWAIAQLSSDLFNKTEISDAVKGIFAPIILSISFIFLINYIKNNFVRLPSLLLGITVGGLGQLILFPSEYFLLNFWKWGVGNGLLAIFVIYFSFFLREKSKLFLLTGFLTFFVISLYFDSRGLAILSIVAVLAYMYFFGKKSSVFVTRFLGKRATLKILVIILPTLFLVNLAASAFFSSEAVLSNFPVDTAAKYRVQATGSYGLLLGGRSEILVSARAFMDKPLLGHGSWAKDKDNYRGQYLLLRSRFGYSLREDGGLENFDVSSLIPSHSYLMGTLVWAGFLGGLFWLIVINNTVLIFIRNLNSLPLYFYVGMVGFMWNVFFSPFAAEPRWSTAIFLAALFSYSRYLNFNNRVAA